MVNASLLRKFTAGDTMLASGGKALHVLSADDWKRVCSLLGNDVGVCVCV